MKNMSQIFIFIAMFWASVVHGDVKLSALPLGVAASTNANDSFPYVDSVANVTKRLKLGDIGTLPALQSTFILNTPAAQNTVLAGPTSGSANPAFRILVGADLPNPAVATKGGVFSLAAVSNNFLTGIGTNGAVTQAQPSCTSLSNGTTSCSTANASAATPSTLVLRDGSGNFSATTITANLTGNASTVTTNANLTGPITSVGNATSVASQTGTGTTFVMNTNPTLVTPNLGTPSTLIGTNISGTGASFTAGNVTTNANLTGPITSVGNATSIAAQTGTGTTFVVQTGPTLTAPVLGAATGTSLSVSGQLTSTVATGTAPLAVSSTTRVSNLNVATAGNADTVTTNANLTGPITSTGNATAIASQTGTGTKFVMDTNPTLVGPALGTPTALVGTNITGTASGLTAGNVTTNANLTGNVTSVGNATTIAAGVVTNAMLAGSIDLTAKVTGVLPIANGGTNASSVTIAPAATAFAGWDANKNLSANLFIPGFTSTATAAGTTTMTIASTQTQYWTGATTQTVKLPTTSVVAGIQYLIVNLSSGAVTVQSSGANTIQILAANTTGLFTSLIATPTAAADWNVNYYANGTVPVALGGTNQTSYTDGQLLIGNSSGNGLTKATLTAGTNVTITNGNGSISIAASAGSGPPTWSYASQATTLNPAVIGTYYVLSGASFTITLPTAASITGQGMVFQHNGTSLTQVYTFNTTSSQTINGIASGTYKLVTAGESLYIVSDGSNWQIAHHTTQTAEVSAGVITVTGTTSNPAKGTTDADKVRWYRVGQYAHLNFAYRQTGTGAAGSGDYKFAIPANMTIDTTNIVAYATVLGNGAQWKPSNSVGSCALSGNTEFGTGFMSVFDTTTLRVMGLGTASQSVIASASNWNFSSANVSVNCDVMLPISTWQP